MGNIRHVVGKQQEILQGEEGIPVVMNFSGQFTNLTHLDVEYYFLNETSQSVLTL